MTSQIEGFQSKFDGAWLTLSETTRNVLLATYEKDRWPYGYLATLARPTLPSLMLPRTRTPCGDFGLIDCVHI